MSNFRPQSLVEFLLTHPRRAALTFVSLKTPTSGSIEYWFPTLTPHEVSRTYNEVSASYNFLFLYAKSSQYSRPSRRLPPALRGPAVKWWSEVSGTPAKPIPEPELTPRLGGAPIIWPVFSSCSQGRVSCFPHWRLETESDLTQPICKSLSISASQGGNNGYSHILGPTIWYGEPSSVMSWLLPRLTNDVGRGSVPVPVTIVGAEYEGAQLPFGVCVAATGELVTLFEVKRGSETREVARPMAVVGRAR